MTKKVLIVEDEYLVSVILEECLEDLGFQVVGTMPSLKAALKAVGTTEFDVAMLDMNLSGESSTPVAEALDALGIPFLFLTGYGQAGVPEQFHARQIVQKPFVLSDLQKALSFTIGN